MVFPMAETVSKSGAKVEPKCTRLPSPARRIKVILFELGIKAEDISNKIGVPRQTGYSILSGRNRNTAARRKIEDLLNEPVWRNYFISELAFILGEDAQEVSDSIEGLYNDADSTIPAKLKALEALLNERSELSALIAAMREAQQEQIDKEKQTYNGQTKHEPEVTAGARDEKRDG
jgi:hypothetical protein